MTSLSTIEAFILAGGKSQRMGSDKGLVKLWGQPLISYSLSLLDSLQIPASIISSNKLYQQFGLPVIKDNLEGKGPMGGLLTALENTRRKNVLLLGCDMPFLTKEVVMALAETSKEKKGAIASYRGQANPLLGIYPLSLLEAVRMHIKQDKLKMQHFVKDFLIPIKDFSGVEKAGEIFTNIHTPEDLAFWNGKS